MTLSLASCTGLAQVQASPLTSSPQAQTQVTPEVDDRGGQVAPLIQEAPSAGPDPTLSPMQIGLYTGFGVMTILLGTGMWLLWNLRRKERFFKAIFENADFAICLVDPDTQRLLQSNAAFEKLLGYSSAEIHHLTLENIWIHGEDNTEDTALTLLQTPQMMLGDYLGDQCLRRKDDSFLYAEVKSIDLLQSHQPLVCLTLHDITDRKQTEMTLHHNATHDWLTGLPNRTSFMLQLQQAFHHMLEQRTVIAVLFIDLDGFKVINDSLGHSAGDELLVKITDKLKKSLHPGERMARFGGDEFVVLLEYIYDVRDAVRVAERIMHSLKEPQELRGQQIHISASIGIACRQGFLEETQQEQQRPEQIIRDADIAMYRAKSQGRARYAVFDETMHQQVVRRLQMETELRQAVDRGELYVLYQPIVLLSSGRIVGFEALIRWNHPQWGPISPGEFIPLAEETGFVVVIDQWMLHQVCWQLMQWQSHLLLDTPLWASVNLSGQHLSQPLLVEQLQMLLSMSGLSPNSLHLEITESLITGDHLGVSTTLQQIRQLGVELSIDDFGTGYSSLSRLHNFPINTLKIDRSFIGRLGPNGENDEMIRMIVTLAHSLGMDVVAEGIETRDQLDILMDLQCEYGQGYLFSHPLEAKVVERLLHVNFMLKTG